MRVVIVLMLVLATSAMCVAAPTQPFSRGNGGDLQWEPAKEVQLAWLQLPDLDGYVMMSQDMYDQGILAECADDFYCDSDDPIVAVEWWGAYWNWLGQFADYFIIRFYTDVPGPPFSQPGTMIYEEPCYIYTEDPDPNGFHYHYYQDLTMPFLQDQCHTYWLSIVALLPWGPGGQWGWAECLPEYYFQDEAVFRSAYFGFPDWTPMSQSVGAYRELAFALYKDVEVPVKPTTWGQVKAMFR